MKALLEVALKHTECLTNNYAVEEARRNLQLKLPQHLAGLDVLLERCQLVRSTVAWLPSVTLKSKDVPILGGAIAGAATHLLTGDERDFGALWGKTVAGVKIVSPKMLADEFVELGWLKKG